VKPFTWLEIVGVFYVFAVLSWLSVVGGHFFRSTAYPPPRLIAWWDDNAGAHGRPPYQRMGESFPRWDP
jgi:hypothetical protein